MSVCLIPDNAIGGRTKAKDRNNCKDEGGKPHRVKENSEANCLEFFFFFFFLVVTRTFIQEHSTQQTPSLGGERRGLQD